MKKSTKSTSKKGAAPKKTTATKKKAAPKKQSKKMDAPAPEKPTKTKKSTKRNAAGEEKIDEEVLDDGNEHECRVCGDGGGKILILVACTYHTTNSYHSQKHHYNRSHLL